MGAIRLAITNSTDEEYGGTYGTTVVLSIPANTYSTYALALTALETAFDGLTETEKLRCKIRRNDAVIINLENISAKSFSACANQLSSNTFIIQEIILSTHNFYYLQFDSTSHYTDFSNQAQSQKLELIII